MRLTTWCEPEWKGDRWQVRQIVEHFPNLFQCLVLRQTARTITRTFELKTDNKRNVAWHTWQEVWYAEDSVKRKPIDDCDDKKLHNALNERINCVLRTGTIEDIMAGKTPEQIAEEQDAAKTFDAAVDKQLASALSVTAGTASLAAFQKKLQEIKADKEKIAKQQAEIVQIKNAIMAAQKPRTLSGMLKMAGVQELTPDERESRFRNWLNS
jgi:hypothetical protein